MKQLVAYILIILLAACSGNTETETPATIPTKEQEPAKSISKFYPSDRTVYLNKLFVEDTFVYEKFIRAIGRPDAVHIGDSATLEEFGANSYDLEYNNNKV